MPLISDVEYSRILKEAENAKCDGSRANDPIWCLQVLFFSLGALGLLLTIYRSSGGDFNWEYGGIALAQVFAGFYARGRWQRRKVVCALQRSLSQVAATTKSQYE